MATRMNFLKEEAEGTQGVDISEIHEKDIVEIISRAEIEETTIMKLQEKFNKMPENTSDPISNKAYFNLCSSKLTNQLASANWKRNKRFIYLHYKIKEMKEKIDKFTKNVLKDNLQMDQNDDGKKIETLIETFKNENEEFIASLIVESYNIGHDDDQKSLIRSNWRKAKLQKRELGWLRSGKAKAKKYDIEKSKYEDILKKMNE